MFRRRSILVHALGARRAPAPPAVEGALADALAIGALEWRQGGRWFSPFWWLECEGRRVATFQPAGGLGRQAVVTTRAGRWRVGSRGLFGGAAIAREGEDEVVARYRPAWLRGGRIERAGAPTLRWHPRFLGRGGAVRDEEGFDMLEIATRGGPFRSEGALGITDAGRRLPDLGPLVMLAWWLVLDAPRHSGAH